MITTDGSVVKNLYALHMDRGFKVGENDCIVWLYRSGRGNVREQVLTDQTTDSVVHMETRSRPSRFAVYKAWSEALRTSPIVLP